MADQCAGGNKSLGGITNLDEMKDNLRMNCIPMEMLEGKILGYDEFLVARRQLMAGKIRDYFQGL
jgi:hypothetical protein